MPKSVKRTKLKSNRHRAAYSLDPFGTSQKDVPNPPNLKDKINSLREKRKTEKCINDAPYICIPPKDGKPGRIFQGCCNSWLCPRCGITRASEEYARICHGSEQLRKDGHKLYMMTITCLGKVDSDKAEKDYLKNTNRLLSTLRAHVKKNKGFWAYCQVTERQRRKHPHSHFITTFIPNDAFYIIENYDRYKKSVEQINALLPEHLRFYPKPLRDFSESDMFSVYLTMACYNAGLGVQCSISRVRSAKAVSLYLAKYMFKAALETDWPKNWKRIRYSQNWPKLDKETNPEAFPVLTREDWNRVAAIRETIVTDDPMVYEKCLLRGAYNVKCTVPNHIDVDESPP